MELIERILKDGDTVKFIATTDRAGRAEFQFCAIWKRGGIHDLYIYPRQQPDAREYFHIISGYSTALSVSSWAYKGIDEPKIWHHVWCKDHKCHSFFVYVPGNSNMFSVLELSTLKITFDKEVV